MARTTTVVLAALGGAAALAGLAAGGWYAWDRGLIPGNPRAPTAEAMEPALRRAVSSLRQGRQGICVEATRMTPERTGVPGMQNRPYPGQHAVAWFVEGLPHTQAERERMFRQLGFLAHQGFYSEHHVTIDTDAGPRPAKEFRLTWKGFGVMVQEHNPCFAAGSRRFDAIASITKVPDAGLGLEIWEVAYDTSVTDVPAWAQAEEVKALFPRYVDAAAARTDKVRLVRSDDGWLTEQEMQAQLQLARLRSGGQDTAALAALAAGRSGKAPQPLPDAATVQKLLEEYLASEAWQARGSSACMPLHVQRFGDDRFLPPPLDRTHFTVAWYDAPATVRREHERAQMLTQLHLLSALERSGFAVIERLKGGTVHQQPVKGGARFTVKPEALETLGLVGRCMPVGTLGKVALLGAVPQGGGLRLAVRGEFTAVHPWAKTLATHLPAVRLLLDEGVPLVGQLQFAPTYDAATGAPNESKWRVTGLQGHYPQPAFQGVPEALASYYPATREAAAAKRVKAPLLLR